MDEHRMLSGSQLVAKGATKKVDGQLPEVGLKEVTPNGSWLEQKQIQSALEARKHLIAVERIEKSGALSHATWRDDLKLAEVIKQTGGHWQYFGHKRGQYLYLLPEETLFLMETNSLLLKHNDVIVSLQKAYALCLSDMPILQYKVYASLSRLGYRVFRHKEPQIVNTDTAIDKNIESQESMTEQSNPMSNQLGVTENDQSETVEDNASNINNKLCSNETSADNKDITGNKNVNGGTVSNKTNNEKESTNPNSTINNKFSGLINITDVPILDVTENINESNSEDITPRMHLDDNTSEKISPNSENNDSTILVTQNTGDVMMENESTSQNLCLPQSSPDTSVVKEITLAAVYSVDVSGIVRPFEGESPMLMETDSAPIVADAATDVTDSNTKDSPANDSFKHYQAELKHYDDKIEKLTERKSNDPRNNEGLDTLQDFHKQQIVKVNVPDEKYLPRNIFLHKTEYLLNMEVVRTQNASNIDNDSRESTPVSVLINSQRLTDSNPRFNTYTQPRYPTYQHRPYYNPRQNYNYMYRTTPSFYTPRYQPNAYFRQQQYMVYNVNMPGGNTNQPGRRDMIKKYHYDVIVNIAMRLKNGMAFPAQVRALHNLINTYNLRYSTNISLSDDFTIIGTPDTVNQSEDEKVITLDEEPKRKKPRLNNDDEKYKSNFEKLKALAAKLKELHSKDLAMSRHRRVFSNAIKTFNKSFNADLYLDSEYRIIDRKTVVVDTSSDSEAIVVQEIEKHKKRKKLRNPYSIFKRMARDVDVNASTSMQVPVLRTLSLNVINDSTSQKTTASTADNRDENLLKFYQSRFSEGGIGGPEVCSQAIARLDALIFQAEYLDDVWKNTRAEFESWIDVKLDILKDIRGSLNLEKQQVEALSNDFYTSESQVQPILKSDCTDLKSALEKLSVIPTNREIPTDTTLSIHFDVCNRDVHFKKSNPPKPNFRVVCYDESAPFPTTDDVVALHARCPDGVPTVFAFVGASTSVSYLQINSVQLPVFIPGHDLT